MGAGAFGTHSEEFGLGIFQDMTHFIFILADALGRFLDGMGGVEDIFIPS